MCCGTALIWVLNEREYLLRAYARTAWSQWSLVDFRVLLDKFVMFNDDDTCSSWSVTVTAHTIEATPDTSLELASCTWSEESWPSCDWSTPDPASSPLWGTDDDILLRTPVNSSGTPPTRITQDESPRRSRRVPKLKVKFDPSNVVKDEIGWQLSKVMDLNGCQPRCSRYVRVWLIQSLCRKKWVNSACGLLIISPHTAMERKITGACSICVAKLCTRVCGKLHLVWALPDSMMCEGTFSLIRLLNCKWQISFILS